MPETVGVILLAFGGADSPQAIEPFMTNLMGGRKPPPALVAKIKERYALIGGKSPLPQITRLQAEALEQQLNTGATDFKVVAGMLHWHPFIAEALDELAQAGVKRVVAVSLAPFYSRVSTGAYEAAVRQALAASEAASEAATGKGITAVFAGGWFNHPMFIAAVVDKVRSACQAIPEARRNDVQVIFSAHSLPVSHIQDGDPYVRQFEAAVAAVAGELGLANRHIAYQSKGGGQGEWLGPSVEEVMDELAAAGRKEVLIVALGFVSDHIETLYDIDIAQRRHAEALGLVFHRAESLNTAPKFIEALAAVVQDSM